ncbi:hypothetical protein D9M68_938630 [compost metagenome]
MNHPSYTRALLVMTSGEAFDRTVVRFAKREALAVRQQNLRYSMRERMLAELEPGAE